MRKKIFLAIWLCVRVVDASPLEQENIELVQRRVELSPAIADATDIELSSTFSKIYFSNWNNDIWKNPPFLTFDVDQNCKDLWEIAQLRIKRKIEIAKFNLDGICDVNFVILHRLSTGLEEMTHDVEYSQRIPLPKGAFFYYMKQIAWMRPQESLHLARFLKEGFKDLVPINRKWAKYWEERAGYLVHHADEFYFPKNESGCKIKE